MKVIVDTSVLISAILRDRDPERIILFIISNPQFHWIASPSIMEEYRSVLAKRKFHLPEDIKQEWFSVMDEVIEQIDVNIEMFFPRDQKDAKFLECALSQNADYLITSDKDFSDARRLISTTILSVPHFVRIFLDPDRHSSSGKSEHSTS